MLGVFTKNTLITFVSRSATTLFTVAITIIIARILGPEGQGVYSVAMLLPIILLVFTSFSINAASVFFIAKRRYPLKEIFGNNIFLNAGISIFTILIALGIIFFFSEKLFPAVDKNYLLLAMLLIPFTLFFELGCHTLLGLQKIKKYNLISFLQRLFFLILILVLLLGFRFGVTAAIFAQVFTLFIFTISVFLIAYRETGGVSFKLNKEYLKEIFSYGVKVHLGSVFSFLHQRIDLFLINFFINPIATGFYYVAARLAEGIWLLSLSAATVLFPRVASETNQKQLKEFTPLVCRNVLFVTLLVTFLLFIFSQWIISLFYSTRFLDSVKPFQILLIGTLFITIWRILANDLTARGKPIINTYIIGFSVILNIVLNIYLIPRFGIVGAAWATVVSYLTMLIFTVFIYSKISGNKIKDIILFQKSDFQFYKNLLMSLKNLKR